MTFPLSSAHKLPAVQLSAKLIPQQQLFDAWHQATSPLFDTTPLKSTRSYTCSVTNYLVNELIFCHTAFDAMQFDRPAHKLSGSESDCITLQYYATGQIRGCLDDGTPLVMEPNRISIQDFAHAYSGIGETTNNFGIVIPRHLITRHDNIYQRHPMFSWSIASPQGRILANTLSNIWQELPHLTQAEAPAVAAGLVGLLNGLLSAQSDEAPCSQVQQATIEAMQAYIRSNLHQPGLGPDHLCQAFHCSRSTLYRLFQPIGGVKAFIRHQRLVRCRHELRYSEQAHTETIGDVAERWGFTSLSYFYRQFKRTFDMTPSEAKSFSRLSPTPTVAKDSDFWGDANTLRYWLEQV